MKKRVFAAIAACFMVLSLTGCGKSGVDELLDGLGGNDLATTSTKSSSTSSKKTDPVSNPEPEVQMIDPFEGVVVTYSGMAPKATAAVSGGNNNVMYEINPKSNLSNGDKVTVTASLRPGVTTLGLSETTKDYTVEGLAGYAVKAADISADIMGKMQSQSEDLITAKTAGYLEGASLKDKKLLGYYFLSPKEGFSTNTNNTIYFVYKLTSTLEIQEKVDGTTTEGVVDAVSYIYCTFKNITIMPDGTCSVDLSAGTLYSNSFNTDYVQKSGWSKWSLPGYKDLDTMFNDVVAKNIANYTYENTVKEDATKPSNNSSSTSSTSDTTSA